MEEIVHLRKLQDEINKYRNSRLPDETKALLQQVVALKLTPGFTTPISNDQSPFPKFFAKFVTSSTALNNSMIDAISRRVFGGGALATIEAAFEKVIGIAEPDICIRLLQVNATLLLPNYVHFNVVASIFSISIQLIEHKVSTVATTAFASTQQMVSMLFESGMTNPKLKTTVVEKRTFERPIVAVSWLLLRDFARLVKNKPTKFLRTLSTPKSFALWEMIIDANYGFINSQPELLKIVESTITHPLTKKKLSYILSFICRYSETPNRKGEQFIARILEEPMTDLALVLIRCVFFKKTELAVNLNVDIIKKLFDVLNEYCDSRAKELLDLRCVPYSPAELLGKKDKELFATTTAIESAIVFVTLSAGSLKNDETKRSMILSNTWQSILELVIKGVRLCHPESVDVIFKAYSNLLLLCSEGGLDEAMGVMFRILCSIVAKQKLVRQSLHPSETIANVLLHTNTEGFGFKKKRAMAYQTVLSLLYNSPSLFSKFYPRLFLSLGMYPRAKVDPQFSAKLNISELSNLCEVLANGTAFCVSLLNEVVTVNQERFGEIWPIVLPVISKMIRDVDMQAEAIDLLVNVTTNCFDESQLAVISSVIENLSTPKKHILMNQVRMILLHNSIRLEHSWNYILTTVAPSHCDGELEIMSSAFSSLHMVCSSHFQRLSEDEMQKCISVVFEFAFQTVDINISLSALGLLWDITPFISQLSRFWKRILSETLVFFNDSRIDVATCALKTFFSLLTSNTQIPVDIYDHLIVNCFIPLLMTFTSFRPESWSVQQLSLQLICHCACSFWDQFSMNPQFISNFWTLLIEKQHNFLMSCQSQEIISAGFQFYEVSFMCDKFDTQLREYLLTSFSKVVTHFFIMEKPMSLVLAAIGRFFASYLPLQKPYLNTVQLSHWLKCIRVMCSKITADTKMTFNAQKGLESASLLFPIDPAYPPEPLEKPLAHEVLKMFVDILSVSENTTLKTCGFECLSKILEVGIPKDDFLEYIIDCKPLFRVPEASGLLKIALDAEFQVNEENCGIVFDVLQSIGKGDLQSSKEANKKLIYVLPMIDEDGQKQYIESVRDNLNLLFAIWNKYCENGSPSFNIEFIQKCADLLLETIFQHLESATESEVLEVLEFVKSSKCYSRTIGTKMECMKWHLYGVLKYLFTLLNSETQSIRKAARETLGIMQVELMEMIVE